MWRRKADRPIEDMVRENDMAEQEPASPAPRPSLFGRKRKPVPFTSEPTARSRDRRSDLTVAALGVTLGLICALFPWYIFFNPDEFGVRAMKFGGRGGGTEPILLGAQPGRVGSPVASQEIPLMELDLRATGTATKEAEEQDDEGTPGLTEQPFPAPVISFRLVQIANGRAMLEDDTGLFVVQPGSILPDSSRVAAVEERDGRPVLVTEGGEVLGVEN
ncbi:MAG: hypothetical protein M3Y43_06670 [Pseudomonadota bacterium]|nr:hypothetical protein [Pseudomonadota bacterium]MDQ2704827.1 hypothetical protein [Pseudomonadota bacterium]